MTQPINSVDNLANVATSNGAPNAIVFSPLDPKTGSSTKSEPFGSIVGGNFPRGKILIIDDEIANVRVLKRYLSGVGYADILTTTDSSSATSSSTM